PAVEIPGCIRVRILEADRLVLVGGWIAVLHQREIDRYPVAEALQFQVPVEPPPRILLPEQDQQQRPEEQQAAGTGHDHLAVIGRRPLPGLAADRAQHDEDRNGDEDAECGGDAVQRPFRIVDGELNGIGGIGGIGFVGHGWPLRRESTYGRHRTVRRRNRVPGWRSCLFSTERSSSSAVAPRASAPGWRAPPSGRAPWSRCWVGTGSGARRWRPSRPPPARRPGTCRPTSATRPPRWRRWTRCW